MSEFENAVSIISENREDFLKVFPEIKTTLEMLDNYKSIPGCKSCIKNKYERGIMTTIALLDKKNRDTNSLLKYKEPRLLGAITKQPKNTDHIPAPNGVIPPIPRVAPTTIKEEKVRDGCPDCVCKHLSQALIMMDEVVQGYPHHVDLALKHVKKAKRYSTNKNITINNKLKNIIKELSMIKIGEDSIDSVFHLSKAKDVMTSILENNNSHPLAVWRIIGHMGEASDECVEHNPGLAAAIRAERLMLMEDPEYRPALANLLNQAKKDKEKDDG